MIIFTEIKIFLFEKRQVLALIDKIKISIFFLGLEKSKQFHYFSNTFQYFKCIYLLLKSELRLKAIYSVIL